MAVMRSLLAALIGISIGIAPVSGEVIVSTMPAEMSTPDSTDMPCCPPDDSKAFFTCGVKCFNFAGALFPVSVSLPDSAETPTPSFLDETLVGHVDPPAHPPPI